MAHLAGRGRLLWQYDRLDCLATWPTANLILANLRGSKVAKPGNVAKQWPSKKIATYFIIEN